MSATRMREDGGSVPPSGERDLPEEGSAVRRAESAFPIPGPARVPREAEQLLRYVERSTLSAAENAQRDRSGVVPARAPEVVAENKPSLRPPVARFGKYDVLGRVAVGGMAEIFLARETLPGGALRQSALKIIKRAALPEADRDYFEELFLREGRTIVQLAHPHICHVYDIGKQGEQLFIAMEWVDGRSLRDVLARLSARGELMTPALAVGIAAQVASALEHAHNARDARNRRLNVVHRDVNPQNIMLRYDGSVKLVDFGVARVSAEVDSRENTVKGKPSYMAPEQLLNKTIDARADVFALGVCLHEMLSGLRLHKRATMRETLTAVLQEPAPSLRDVIPDLPVALDAIVRRALEKQPDQRFGSAGEFQAALEHFLAEHGEVGSARRVGELMTSLYPEAEAATLVDSSEEATQHLRALSAEPSAGPLSRLLARRWWVAALIVLGALFLAALWPRTEAAAPRAQRTGSAPNATKVADPEAVVPAAVIRTAPVVVGAPGEAAPVEAAPLEVAPADARGPAMVAPQPARSKRRKQSPGFVADPGF